MLTFIGSSEISSKTMATLSPKGGCEDGLLDTQALGASGQWEGDRGIGALQVPGLLGGGAKHLLTLQVRLHPA